MALTIEQLYQQYAGRAPDPEGLAYWARDFGSTIDPREVEVFKAAVAEARAQGTEPAAQAAPVVAPAAVPNYSGGLDLNAGGFQIPGTSAPAPTVNDHRGKSYDTQQLLNLAKQIAPTLDANNLAGGVYSTNKGNIGFAFEDAEKVLGYAPTAAEQVVLDMARHLIDEGVTDLSQVQPADQNRRFGATYTGEGGTIYEIQKDPVTGQVRTQTWGKTTSDKGNIVAALSIGAGLLGVPLSLGSALAPSLSTAAQGALGGALLGGGSAALAGGNVLQGALLGGAGGYLQGANAAPTQDSIYSLANGTPNLDYMGGGQGLTSTGAANLPSMGGAQGLQILAGVPSETLAGALSTFGGVNPAIIEGMGLGSGISYVTPSGIVTGNGTIIGGDVISELGKNTGFNLPGWLNENVGAGIGDTLAQVNTGVNSGLFSGVTPPDSTSTTTQKDVTTSGSSTGLTPGQIANLIKAGVGLVGATGAVSAATNAGGNTGTPMQAPTQGVPTNDPNYYNQLQQYYNAYLPQTPRDVVTPLQQWYNSSYGA